MCTEVGAGASCVARIETEACALHSAAWFTCDGVCSWRVFNGAWVDFGSLGMLCRSYFPVFVDSELCLGGPAQ